MSAGGQLETKEDLIMNVKEWIKMDNEISAFQNEIKDRKNKKKQLTDRLVNVMKKNEIDCVDIKGGALIYKKTTTKKPINAKTLMTVLKDYYKNTNPQIAEELTKHILENREESVKETIKRKMDK
jgi:hypothetical protein